MTHTQPSLAPRKPRHHDCDIPNGGSNIILAAPISLMLINVWFGKVRLSYRFRVLNGGETIFRLQGGEKDCALLEKRYDNGRGLGAIIPQCQNVTFKVWMVCDANEKTVFFTRHFDVRTGSMFLIVFKHREFMDTGRPSSDFEAVNGRAWDRPPNCAEPDPIEIPGPKIDQNGKFQRNVAKKDIEDVKRLEKLPDVINEHQKIGDGERPLYEIQLASGHRPQKPLCENHLRQHEFSTDGPKHDSRPVTSRKKNQDSLPLADKHKSGDLGNSRMYSDRILPSSDIRRGNVDIPVSDGITALEIGDTTRTSMSKDNKNQFWTASKRRKTELEHSTLISKLDTTLDDRIPDGRANNTVIKLLNSVAHEPLYDNTRDRAKKSNPRDRFKNIVASDNADEDRKQLKKRELEFLRYTERNEVQARLVENGPHSTHVTVNLPAGVHPERVRLLTGV